MDLTNTNSFFNNPKIESFLFVTAIISLVFMSIVMNIISKHAKLRSLVTSLALLVLIMQDIECTCETQWYMIVTLGLVILGIMIFIVINARKLKLFRGHLFSNAVKVMLFISDAQYYILVKLCRTAGSIHLFKITGKLTLEHIELKRNMIWYIIEIDWEEVSMTFNKNKVNLPTSDIIPFRDKFKIRCIVRQEPLLLHVMLKQGMTWFSLVSNKENFSETA